MNTAGRVRAERRLTAILAADVAGYSRLIGADEEDVSGAIQPALERDERERVSRRPPESLDAWESYHRGMWHFAKYEEAELGLARSFFERAVALDPGFAAAYSALALSIFWKLWRCGRTRERKHAG